MSSLSLLSSALLVGWGEAGRTFSRAFFLCLIQRVLSSFFPPPSVLRSFRNLVHVQSSQVSSSSILGNSETRVPKESKNQTSEQRSRFFRLDLFTHNRNLGDGLLETSFMVGKDGLRSPLAGLCFLLLQEGLPSVATRLRLSIVPFLCCRHSIYPDELLPFLSSDDSLLKLEVPERCPGSSSFSAGSSRNRRVRFD